MQCSLEMTAPGIEAADCGFCEDAKIPSAGNAITSLVIFLEALHRHEERLAHFRLQMLMITLRLDRQLLYEEKRRIFLKILKPVLRRGKAQRRK